MRNVSELKSSTTGLYVSKGRRQEILKALDKLNQAVGTRRVDEVKTAVGKLLPMGYHLDFGLHSKMFCVVDHMNARVL